MTDVGTHGDTEGGSIRRKRPYNAMMRVSSHL